MQEPNTTSISISSSSTPFPLTTASDSQPLLGKRSTHSSSTITKGGAYIRTSFNNYTSLHPIFTPRSLATRTLKYFTIVLIANVVLGAVWLAISIWLGVEFTSNAAFQPDFLLGFLPVFLTMAAGLGIECIPLMVIIRTLQDDDVVPYPVIQTESIFLVVSTLYIAAPVALCASLYARIDYGFGGCFHSCGLEELLAISPIIGSLAHLVVFVLRLWGILGAVRTT